MSRSRASIGLTAGLTAAALMLAAASAAAQMPYTDAPRQQCYCNGTWIEVPRGRVCRDVCGGGGAQGQGGPQGQGSPRPQRDELADLLRTFSDAQRRVFEELSPAERASLQSATEAVARRQAEVLARSQELRGQLQGLLLQRQGTGPELARLQEAVRKLEIELAELQRGVAALAMQEAETQRHIAQMDDLRRRMRADYLAAASRARSARTAYWKALGELVSPNALASPSHYIPAVRTPEYATLRRQRTQTSGPALAGPLAQSRIGPATAGPLASAIARPAANAVPQGSLPQRLDQLIEARATILRLQSDISNASAEAGRLRALIESERRAVDARSRERASLAGRRDMLQRAVEAGERRLRSAGSAARDELQALWRTAKEELLWNSAMDGLHHVADLTFGRSEALREHVQKVTGAWDHILSALPDAAAQAGSPDAYTSGQKVWVASLVPLYMPDPEPRKRPLDAITPRSAAEREVWNAAIEGGGGRIRMELKDERWPAELGWVKKAYPWTQEEFARHGGNVRQLHYVENLYTAKRADLHFPVHIP